MQYLSIYLSRDDPVVVDGKLYGQDFDEIKASCLGSGELFTDPEFPADNDSIYFSKVVLILYFGKHPQFFCYTLNQNSEV